MSQLTKEQKDKLKIWRREVMENNHVLSKDKITEIEQEVVLWPCVQALDKTNQFFEPLVLFDSYGERQNAKTWRGLCHWLWLRHGCVQGAVFMPSKMVVLQRRAMSVQDSPGYLDMAFAGHMGLKTEEEALRSEAKGEMGLNPHPESSHVQDKEDLEPVHSYGSIEPPRPTEEFYNAEWRLVFAIRITHEAAGEIYPLDKEVGSFLLATIQEAWALLRAEKVASALQQSGPHALYHALTKWNWE